MYLESKLVQAKDLELGDMLLLDSEEVDLRPIKFVAKNREQICIQVDGYVFNEDPYSNQEILVKINPELDQALNELLEVFNQFSELQPQGSGMVHTSGVAHSCDCFCINCKNEAEKNF